MWRRDFGPGMALPSSSALASKRSFTVDARPFRDAAKRAASPHSPSRVCDRKDGAGGVGHGHCKVEA